MEFHMEFHTWCSLCLTASLETATTLTPRNEGPSPRAFASIAVSQDGSQLIVAGGVEAWGTLFAAAVRIWRLCVC